MRACFVCTRTKGTDLRTVTADEFIMIVKQKKNIDYGRAASAQNTTKHKAGVVCDDQQSHFHQG